MTQPPMPADPIDWETLGRYLAGESSSAEADEVRRWLESHPTESRLMSAVSAAVSSSMSDADVEAALARVKTRMHAPPPRVPLARTAQTTPWRRYAAMAAAAAVVATAGLLLTQRGRQSTDTVAPATFTYSTAVGERKEVVLHDGTQVILGPASRLVGTGRAAELQGEAFFSVVHDSAHPFSVRAGTAVIRDVGTEFTVHSDAGEMVRVVVSEGVVALSHQRDSVILQRGDVGMLDTQGQVQARRGAATDDDMAWTLGRLVFRDASVAELAADLRRWYGVQLRVTDSALLRRHFTGSFSRETPDRVLDVIALALGARVERRGDTAFVRTAAPGR